MAETDGAPTGLEAARKRLLNTSADLWSGEDRSVVGAMFQQRIAAERERADFGLEQGSLLDQLARALDYRHWHHFRVERWQDAQWRKLTGPASSGERALRLTVPLFAAVASFYSQSTYAHAPRLMLLDEAFAGIDDLARAHCMALIREFDLDFVMTSEREWGCHAALPGVANCSAPRASMPYSCRVGLGTVARKPGDFDWPGLQIANEVMDAYGASPWRFCTADYCKAVNILASATHRLEGAPVRAVWDLSLSDVMQAHGVAFAEEALAASLLPDLSR